MENNAIIILMLFVAVGVGIYKISFVSMASFKNLALNTAVRFIIAVRCFRMPHNKRY